MCPEKNQNQNIPQLLEANRRFETTKEKNKHKFRFIHYCLTFIPFLQTLIHNQWEDSFTWFTCVCVCTGCHGYERPKTANTSAATFLPSRKFVCHPNSRQLPVTHAHPHTHTQWRKHTHTHIQCAIKSAQSGTDHQLQRESRTAGGAREQRDGWRRVDGGKKEGWAILFRWCHSESVQ